MYETDWILVESTEQTFRPEQVRQKESIFSLCNGYLGTRGSFEEGYPGQSPVTLINGVYDDVLIGVKELANCPDWLALSVFLDGDRFRLDQGQVLAYQRWLDLKRGVLSRKVRWCSPSGHVVEFHFERFASLADPHVLALRCQMVGINFSGPVEVHASLDSYTHNDGVMHWERLRLSEREQPIWLQLRSRHSGIELGMAAQLTVAGSSEVQTRAICIQGLPTLVAHFNLQAGQMVTLDKTAIVYTSRDGVDPLPTALAQLAQVPDYDTLLDAQGAAWAAVWEKSDIVIEGDQTAQLAVRYNLFQILSVTPRQDDRVSIPAKTLTGFAYKGHIFWDTEIFMLPLLAWTQPELARNLLNYRYHTLPGARRKAQAAGYEGAMYPWESADTGDEVTPRWIPGPSHRPSELIRIWCGDLEVHISSDVAYAIWQYWRITGDDTWMAARGSEMILDTALFWASRVTWSSDQYRYEILQVVGPDENHERVDNNVFTNRMVQWHLQTALQVLDWLQQYDGDRATALVQQLNLTTERLQGWREIVDRMWIPQDATSGIFEQFEGFFKLEEISLPALEPRDRSVQALFGIERTQRVQVLKQPDVLMQFFLLRHLNLAPADLPELSDQLLALNWDYYSPRTDHTYGSSLGPAVHSILASELGKLEEAYQFFMKAALVDLADNRSNSHEGIHGATAGGVWQAVILGFAGLRWTENGPVVSPRLPANWTRLKFTVTWQGQPYTFDLTPDATPARSDATIQAVIFDLDGVLTDTSEFHYQAWQRLADEEGLPFDRTANEALRGVSRRDSLLRLLQGRQVGQAHFESMMARKNGYYVEFLNDITAADLLPGVPQFLQELRAAGIKIAIGSSSKNAPMVIERLGIRDQIDAIADGNSVTQSKPAPDVFLHAAAQLGLPAHACVVFEDAESGVEAALRAGMAVVGLGPEERVGQAHLVLPDLSQAHWPEVHDRLISLFYRTATPSKHRDHLTIRSL